MKAITLNTHSWMEEEPQEKLAQIVDFLATQEADVIALQEVNQLISAKEIIPDDYFLPTRKSAPPFVKIILPISSSKHCVNEA